MTDGFSPSDTGVNVTLILKHGDEEIDRQAAKMNESGVLADDVTFSLDKAAGRTLGELTVFCEDAFGRLILIEKNDD